jgi:hypothetical protein
MIKNTILFLIVISITSCASLKKHNESISQLHSVIDLKDDVNKIHKQLVKHHPKIYQYITKNEFDYKFDSLKQMITKPINSKQFFEKIGPIIVSVHQGHISVIPPFRKFSKEERKVRANQKLEFSNLDFEEFNNKVYISNVIDKRDSLLIGAEVVKINDVPVHKLVNKYKTYFASDGYNKTLKKRFVNNSFKSYYYVDNGVADSLKIVFRKNDSTFFRDFKRVTKVKKKVITTQLKKRTKAERKENKLKQKEKWEFNDKYGYIKSRKEFTRNFKYIGKDSTVAYMKIRGFTTGNYEEFYKESFSTIDSLKTSKLIIDLRDNSGGRLSEIEDLYSYLATDDYIMINPCEVNSRIPYF